MTIPDYQSIMLPFLKFVANGKEHSLREIITGLADEFKLNDEERRELLPSGKQPVFDNRVGWASTYLKKAGVVETPKRATYRITDRGQSVLGTNPDRVDIKLLEQFPEFKAFRARKDNSNTDAVSPKQTLDINPEELFESASRTCKRPL